MLMIGGGENKRTAPNNFVPSEAQTVEGNKPIGHTEETSTQKQVASPSREESDKPLFSIIVPHYNSPELLRRCLDSIPRRDDIQIIVVDDNSDPAKVDFDNFPGLNDEQVEVVLTKEGGGAGYARNVGLDKVKGKWVLFADADDYFTMSAFNTFDKYVDTPVDYHCFKAMCVNSVTLEKMKQISTSDKSTRKYFKKGKKALNVFLYKNFACWNKMISAKFLRNNNIRFEESRVNNDVWFSFQVAYKAKAFNVIDEELYCHTFNPNSITFTKRSVEREFLFYRQAKKRNGFYDAIRLGWGFKRYDWMYLPYMLKKRGLSEAIKFYKYCYKHRDELSSTRQEYLTILR